MFVLFLIGWTLLGLAGLAFIFVVLWCIWQATLDLLDDSRNDSRK